MSIWQRSEECKPNCHSKHGPLEGSPSTVCRDRAVLHQISISSAKYKYGSLNQKAVDARVRRPPSNPIKFNQEPYYEIIFCDHQAHRLALPPQGENCSRGTGTASSRRVQGTNDIPVPYANLGDEELMPGDVLFEDNANHYRRTDGGWTE